MTRVVDNIDSLLSCRPHFDMTINIRQVFRGIDCIHPDLSALPVNLYKTQSDFLRALTLPSFIRFAKADPIKLRYIVFNRRDTKTILFSLASNIIYDPEPYWLNMMPRDLLEFSPYYGAKYDEPCIPVRASMSFAHFLAGELGSLLVADRVIPKEVPILMPHANRWHIEILEYFGISRNVNIALDDIAPGKAYDLRINRPYIFEHLMEYEGICIARFNALKRLAADFALSSNQFTTDTRPIVWLTRAEYELVNNLTVRTINFNELQIHLSDNFPIDFCNPEQLPIQVVAAKIYQAKLIICESGSLFLNYILFASHNTKIIQLTPKYCLGPTFSFYNVNNMQWYWPVLNHLWFFEGNNTKQFKRQYGSPWNVPSSYDPAELASLIAALML